MLVEEIERLLRRRAPGFLHRAGLASDTAQFGLQRARKIDGGLLLLIRGRYGGELLLFRWCLLSGKPCQFEGRVRLLSPPGLIRSDPRLLLFDESRSFSGSCLLLFDLLRLLGRDACFLGGLSGGGGLCLLGLSRALGSEARLLLLRLPCLLCGGYARRFGRDLPQLELCQIGIEPLRIRPEKRFPCISFTGLQRQLVVAPNGC